jgi:uncharacterized membrane protein YccC
LKDRLSLQRLSPRTRLSLRAAFCLTVPLVIGVLVDQRSYGTLVALGALWGISQDGLDRWRLRGPRLLGVALAAAVGIAIGSFFETHVTSTSSLVVLLGVIALVAGVIEASLWSTQGMYLLLGAIIGSGLGFAGHTWEASLAVACGALWVYSVASLSDRRSRRVDQRSTLYHAFRTLAVRFETIDAANALQVRARAIATLDTAQDVIGAESVDTTNLEAVALHQCFVVALQFGELTSYLQSTGASVSSEVCVALRDVAEVIRYQSARDGLDRLREYETRFTTSARSDLEHYVARAFHPPAASAFDESESFRSTVTRLPMLERLRFAALLSAAIMVATLIAHIVEGPKGYWLPMSVAFIFRPDLGPVVRRATARTFGTLAGVAIAALVSLSGNQELVLIVLSCAMAASVPLAAQRSHALTVMVFTPIVFVFIGVLGSDQGLFVPRIIDTAIAAGIVFIIDYVAWLHAPSLRPRQQLERARAAAWSYRETREESDMVTRHSRRRNALRAVNRARSSLVQARVEPHLFADDVGSFDEQLDGLVELIDAHTVYLIESE